jgi:transcriptional regulator with XRE-family HTH domain
MKDKLRFNEEEHKYYFNDKELTSVRTFIGGFFSPFEEDKIAGFTAKAKGITKEEVLAELKTMKENNGITLKEVAAHLGLESQVLAEKHVEALAKVAELEADLDKVFSRIGRSEESLQAERFIAFIKRHGKISYTKAYHHIHSYFPDFRDFEGILAGAIRSGLIRMRFEGNSTQPEAAVLEYIGADK